MGIQTNSPPNILAITIVMRYVSAMKVMTSVAPVIIGESAFKTPRNASAIALAVLLISYH